MPSAKEFIINFVLDQAIDQPSRKRIQIYRALATFSGDPGEAKRLSGLADDLECAEKKSREFNFEFKSKTNQG